MILERQVFMTSKWFRCVIRVYFLFYFNTSVVNIFVFLITNNSVFLCDFLQEVQCILSEECVSNNNEINAIRLCLIKAISSTPYHKGFRSSNVKKINIDLPCTPNVFIENFVGNVPLIKYCGQNNYKCTVTASDLDKVFGRDWSSFIYKRSSARQRIIGLIIIHYRSKQVAKLTICTTFR